MSNSSSARIAITFLALRKYQLRTQTDQLLTWRTMSQMRLSRSWSSGEFKRLLLPNAAQQKPLCVRTAMVDVPGRLPVCDQLSNLLTAQPFA
jgi:hypothetical protein